MGFTEFFLDQNEYHLTDEQTDIVDEKNAEFPITTLGNINFNTWFRGFLKENSIRPVNRRMARYWTSGTENSKKDSIKLAVTLRAMRSIVSVMDPEHNLTVEYNDKADTSSWDNAGRVILPTQPVREAEDLYTAINIEGGFAIHEACHSKHTRKVVSKDALKPWAEKAKLNMPLANLLEDERIESVEMQENPGFRSYLNAVNEALWNPVALKNYVGDKWEDCTTQQKLAVAIPAVRYYEQVKALLDPSFAPVIDAAHQISAEYTALGENVKFADMKDYVQRLKKALVISDEEESEMPSPEKARGPIESPCGAKHDVDDGLDSDEAQEILDLVEQEVEQLDGTNTTRWMPEGVDVPRMTVLRPKVTAPNQMPKVDNLLNKAKAALTFRKAAPRADERNMLSGELDEDELARLFMDDMRVFRDITEEVLPSAAVYLLVDCSGSMRIGSTGGDGGSRIGVAQKMAYLLLESMRSKPNVTCKVLAHTGDNDPTRYASFSSDYTATANFYRIWEEGDPTNRLSIIQTIEHGENYDSFAVAWAGEMLAEENAEQKILIVLSDGEPSGRRYGGHSAMKHMRKHVDRLMRKGVDVLSISVAPELNEKAQQMMYKHYITAPRGRSGFYSSLLTNLQRVLEKVGSR